MSECISTELSRKVDEHQKLLHTIEKVAEYINTLVDCEEKHIYEKVVDYLIELQMIKSKEL